MSMLLKLENLETLQIHFHTICNLKAKMEYARTKDMLNHNRKLVLFA
ncbi:MAG: hypothetical protein QXU95_06500 [Candidatus Bathyarchaeia archaeon]